MRPPPSKTNHPLNLQVQLVPPHSKEKDRSISSRRSFDSSTDAGEDGMPLSRTSSNRSDVSMYSGYTSVTSFSSVASTSSTTSDDESASSPSTPPSSVTSTYPPTPTALPDSNSLALNPFSMNVLGLSQVIRDGFGGLMCRFGLGGLFGIGVGDRK